MKSAFAMIIILAAIFTLTAGGFAMLRMNDDAHANCLAAIPGQPNCVGIFDRVKLAMTHINALLGASLGIVSSFALVLFSSLMLLAWAGVSDTSNLLSTASNYSRMFIEGNSRSIHKQRRWISLLEKRDPTFLCAMNA